MRTRLWLLWLDIVFYFVCAFPTGPSLSDQVYQTPTDMYNRPQQTAKINCSHSIPSYDRILWYKQSQSRQLQFWDTWWGTVDFQRLEWMWRWKGVQTKTTCTLTFEALSPDSSAVYFCAARLRSATDHCSSGQKPQTHFFIIKRGCGILTRFTTTPTI